eukprot:gnl/MRDRNA2_/MRDRNA2_76629_c0_seq1.p1 gnl/MRDRNA2_/MRDRNA2_76629_c0~~gnl/MRDRNA2_/MRDRNA2_76629_c0_seq1.p1  ORF type:complete len:177 (+),score=36.80 gnl/MRDRNA2_/MRDRNA2_76629_c0_seq1:103-633(+)
MGNSSGSCQAPCIACDVKPNVALAQRVKGPDDEEIEANDEQAQFDTKNITVIHTTETEKEPIPDGSIETGQRWVVDLDRSGHERKNLGIDVDPRDGVSLLIQKIDHGGVVEDWNNTQADDDNKVMVHDRIIGVNDATGSSSQMLKECVSAAKLKLLLVRNCPFGPLKVPSGLTLLK